VVYVDITGTITRWNGAARDLFGYSALEAFGQRLDLIIPPHLREAHWTGFTQAIHAGVTKHKGQTVLTGATHKDGQHIYAGMAFPSSSGRTVHQALWPS
jgi:PAS domain S-box-containing protein